MIGVCVCVCVCVCAEISYRSVTNGNVNVWGWCVTFVYLCLQVMVPSKELVLAGKDAAAEYDELAEPQDFQDDPE